MVHQIQLKEFYSVLLLLLLSLFGLYLFRQYSISTTPLRLPLIGNLVQFLWHSSFLTNPVDPKDVKQIFSCTTHKGQGYHIFRDVTPYSIFPIWDGRQSMLWSKFRQVTNEIDIAGIVGRISNVYRNSKFIRYTMSSRKRPREENHNNSAQEIDTNTQIITSLTKSYCASVDATQSVKSLREIAQKLGIKDYSKLSKKQLCKQIGEHFQYIIEDIKECGEEIPEDFLDPIMLTPLVNPFVASDGLSYNASTLNEMFTKAPGSRGAKGEVLQQYKVLPNVTLRKIVIDWLIQRGIEYTEEKKPEVVRSQFIVDSTRDDIFTRIPFGSELKRYIQAQSDFSIPIFISLNKFAHYILSSQKYNYTENQRKFVFMNRYGLVLNIPRSIAERNGIFFDLCTLWVDPSNVTKSWMTSTPVASIPFLLKEYMNGQYKGNPCGLMTMRVFDMLFDIVKTARASSN